MEDEKWSSASLHIISQSVSTKEITGILNTEATSSHEKGSLIQTASPGKSRYQETLWILESDLDYSEPLEIHIMKLVSFIEQKTDAFRKLLHNCDVELFCGFSSGNGQGGVVLGAELLKRLTTIPIDFILDLYPPEKYDSSDKCDKGGQL
ncbi:MAG: DUF4279 domain-containing protein [Desulfobacterales bacterium]|nr:DUF4279 domain-containing protein [Desulfobacterales bacterium]